MMKVTQYEWNSSRNFYGLVGTDFMTHLLKLNLLARANQDYWIAAVLHCKCYLTQADKFSVGQFALDKWIRREEYSQFWMKEDIIRCVKNVHKSDVENYRTFNCWYNRMLPKNKCFFHKNEKWVEGHYPLRLTDAFINNLFKALYLGFEHSKITHMTDKNLWVDVQGWELSEIGLPEDMFETKEHYNENRYKTPPDPATGLPREVWTS